MCFFVFVYVFNNVYVYLIFNIFVIHKLKTNSCGKTLVDYQLIDFCLSVCLYFFPLSLALFVSLSLSFSFISYLNELINFKFMKIYIFKIKTFHFGLAEMQNMNKKEIKIYQNLKIHYRVACFGFKKSKQTAKTMKILHS